MNIKRFAIKTFFVAVILTFICALPSIASGLELDTDIPSSIKPPLYALKSEFKLNAYLDGELAQDAVWSIDKTDGSGFELSADGILTVTGELSGGYVKLKCSAGGQSQYKYIYFNSHNLAKGSVAWVANGWGGKTPGYAIDGNESTIWNAGAHSLGSNARLYVNAGSINFNTVKLKYTEAVNCGAIELYTANTASGTVPTTSGTVYTLPTLNDMKRIYHRQQPLYDVTDEYVFKVKDASCKYIMFSSKVSTTAIPTKINEIYFMYLTPGDMRITGLPERIFKNPDEEKKVRTDVMLYDSDGNEIYPENAEIEWKLTAPDGVWFDDSSRTLHIPEGVRGGNIHLTATAKVGNSVITAKMLSQISCDEITMKNSSGKKTNNIPSPGTYTASVSSEGGRMYAVITSGSDATKILTSSSSSLNLELKEGEKVRVYYWDENLAPLAEVWKESDEEIVEEEIKTPADKKDCSYLDMTAVSEAFVSAKTAAYDYILMAEDFSGILAYGNRSRMSHKPEFESNGLYVPLEAVTLSGGSVKTVGTKQYITIKKGCFVTVKDGTHIKASDFATAAGATLIRNSETGLLVFAPSGSIQADDNLLKVLHYERPTAEEIFSRVEATNARPRVLMNAEKFEQIKHNIETDELVASWYATIKQKADTYLTKPVAKYEIVSGRLLGVSGEVSSRVTALSFVYLMTGEEAYAERAWKELENAARFDDWHPSHFLDVGEMSIAFAIGYDWLNSYLTEPQKAILVKAFEEKAISPYNAVQLSNSNWAVTTSNWNSWVRYGVLSCVLSMCEDLTETTSARYAIEGGLIGLEYMIDAYAPKGAWIEGTAYWAGALQYLVSLIDTLEYSTGQYWGYDNLPGFEQTAYFSTYMSGAGGAFNFADTTVTRDNPSAEFWFAARYGDDGLKNLRLRNMRDYKLASSMNDILWYVPTDDTTSLPTLDGDMFYDNTDVAVFHNGWEKTDTFVGFKGADTGASHYHYDGGTFIMDFGGQRFASELGRDGYAITEAVDNGRNIAYKIRAEGHNTLVINPSEDPGQRKGVKAHITNYSDSDDARFAIADLTPLYEDKGLDDGYTASSIKRGVKVNKKTDSVIVQDEVHLTKESEMYWFMHTKAQIEISADGKSAVLTLNGVSIRAELMGDENALFTSMPAYILPTTPELPNQGKNTAFRKLAIHFENVKDTQYAVKFTPLDSSDEASELTPLSEW